MLSFVCDEGVPDVQPRDLGTGVGGPCEFMYSLNGYIISEYLCVSKTTLVFILYLNIGIIVMSTPSLP